jgi:hypothetical protein
MEGKTVTVAMRRLRERRALLQEAIDHLEKLAALRGQRGVVSPETTSGGEAKMPKRAARAAGRKVSE